MKKYEAPYIKLAEISRKVSAEGSVLLKNECNVLPIDKNAVISLFGRTQIDYHKSGTGSGGLVRTQYVANILDGIKNNPKLTLNEELVEVYKKWLIDNPFDVGEGWAKEPWSQKEMIPTEEIVKKAKEASDVAVIVIGRTAGEDRDNGADEGSWYLAPEEEAMLKIVSKHFDKTVVLLNTGNIIDMQWVEKYNIKAVMYVWQGGQEGGNAVADLLCGDVTPCGKLSDTIAKHISMYPALKNFGNKDYNLYEEDIYVGYRYFETFAQEDVLYPFGYGLSYTNFSHSVTCAEQKDNKILIDVSVKNTGDYKGKDIVEVYFEAPQGLLGKSARELCGFLKTKELNPNEEQVLKFEIDINALCAYDDSGITGNKSCYVLEQGDYNIYVGTCVRSASNVFTFTQASTVVVKKCTEAMAPVKEFNVMYPVLKDGKYQASYRKVSTKTTDYKTRINNELPTEITPTDDKGIKLIDVKDGKNTMDEFIAQLSDLDLICLARGEGMCSTKVRPGSAAAMGGLTDSLVHFGIPAVAMHDGPSGLRMDNGDQATSLPNGTAIACTWNVEIAEEIYDALSIELLARDIDCILGPGVNIHRIPLNGRNFEYLSEDPYLSGMIASALCKGISNHSNNATIKHFAANSQELARKTVDSVMSERAAREIYLRSFQYAIQNGYTKTIMTSYNPFNGMWTANNYELNTTILRDEWGYDGVVVTDWWPRLEENEGEKKNLTYMVEAQNDVYMVVSDQLIGNDNLVEALQKGDITRAQLQRNAKNVLNYLMSTNAFQRFLNGESGIKASMVNKLDELKTVAVVENPENLCEYPLNLTENGDHLICIDYVSPQPDVAQIIITVYFGAKDSTSFTINGTNGELKTTYKDLFITNADATLKIKYQPSQMDIKKVELKK